MHDHPEMTFDEQEVQLRRETARRERAAYPERFREKAPKVNRQDPHQPNRFTPYHFGGRAMPDDDPELVKATKYGRQVGRPVPDKTWAVPDKSWAPQGGIASQVMALGQRQAEVLRLEKQGLADHAKTQHVVEDLQRQIKELTGVSRHVSRTADKLADRQKSAQNTTGNP